MSPETVPDAGAPDAGFTYTMSSVGIATFTGAVTGTAAVFSNAGYNGFPYPEPDGGTASGSLEWSLSTQDISANPRFACGFTLVSTPTLPTGIVTGNDATYASCEFIYVPDGGTEQDWGGEWGSVSFKPPGFLEVNIRSTGPGTAFSGDGGTIWLDPTATLDVYLEPGPGQAEGVGISVTVVPPACPPNCVSNR
jgi:hypothetical protein